MSKTRKLIFTLLVTFFSFLTLPQSLSFAANDLNIETIKQNIYPNSPYYPVKRLWEKVGFKFMFFKNSKIGYQQSLLQKRFSELVYIVENQDLDNVETSSNRFAYQAGIYSDLIDKEHKENILKEFAKMSADLAKVRDAYPANSSFWMLIQHDINTLSILKDKLK